MARKLNISKKKSFWIIAIAIFVGLYFFADWYAREQRMVSASYEMLNDAQTIWYPNPVLDYHIIVDVVRPGETRRNEVRVKNGNVVFAEVKYWKRAGIGWEAPFRLNEDQSYPFTIPGLYDMVRGALMAENRYEIRVDMQGNPPFPHDIEFGPVWENGRPIMDTEARIVVRKFEVQATP